MHKDLNKQIDSDPEVTKLRSELDEILKGRPLGDRPTRGMPDPKASIGRISTKEAQARWDAEYQAWRKRYAPDLKSADPDVVKFADLADAERRVKIAYLSSIRPMGPQPGKTFEQLGFTDSQVPGAPDRVAGEKMGPASLYDAMMAEGLAIYPTAWIDIVAKRYYHRGCSADNRAFHRGPPVGADPRNPPDMPKGKPVIALDNRDRPLGSGKTQGDVARHEMLHAMETWIPGLTALQWAELFDRAGRREGGNWEDYSQINLPGARSSEVGIRDYLADIYAGKSYLGKDESRKRPHRAGWELLATGIVDFFNKVDQTKVVTKSGDDGLTDLILGILVTLHAEEGK